MTATINYQYKRLGKFLSILALSTATVFTSGQSFAISSDYDSIPPTIQSGSANTDPLVMLAMSNDHQLYIKAYTDYSDLDGDGTIDTTYTDAFDYYGYFDSNRCYSYASGKFTPQEAVDGSDNHQCSTNSRWSGNFLNWATMTRMDVLRKVLYGGTRSTDTTSSTVLERVQIPTDVHAFVKTFTTTSTADMKLYTPYNKTEISLCSVTLGSGASQSSNSDPLLRVSDGIWPAWSNNERAQCLYRNERNGGLGIEPPSSSADGLADLVVRVDVCVAGKLESNCKQYPSGSPKPTGLLQKFGERDSSPIRFGLITGSYTKNLSGGVLRKDISKILGNSSSSLDEINSSTGQIIPGSDGIVDTINSFRISGYNFDSPFTYTDCNSPGILNITEGSSSTGCSMWGNPMSEIYMEALRYFSGETSPSSAFNTDDSSAVPSLPAPVSTWTDPMNSDNFCASCNVVVISTGLNSFDTNQMSSASNIPGLSGASDVNTKTNTVGTSEGISGNYIIGEGSSSTDKQCTSKSVTNFSDAKGICPELPTLEGGFQIAGLAHHAHITDLRPDNSTFPDNQTVDTYAISLAESLPSFTIPVNGKSVTFAPHCEANSSGSASTASSNWRICSMADVTIESLAADNSSGSMLFTWEDSTWGFDYDMDGVERITWCVGPTACSDVSMTSDQVKITASAELTAAGHAMLFGYTISGTNSDGVKRHVLRPGGQNFNVLYSPFSNAGNQPADVATIYTASGSAAALFENPLWYAAKYGSFTDLNGNDIPDQVSEWDSQNNSTGVTGVDGIPDNFFQVTNPAILETQLEKIFTDIVARTSAGSALAVLSTNTNGNGAVYQALYDPIAQVGTQTITWGGRVHALFVDDSGFFREDSDTAGTKGKLDDYSIDNIVELFYSASDERTVLRRYTSVANFNSGTFTQAELSTLQPIWNARDKLAELDDATIQVQRAYNTPVSSSSGEGRHILTWIDGKADGVVDGVIDSGEFTDFTEASFASFTSNYGLLNTSDQTEANNIIKYIRGKEISGFRSRTIDFDGDGIDEVWRLGDVIHSTPVVVAAPNSSYDLIYNDPTYKTFADFYSNRREVIYTGANDGMLHAFNSGFYTDIIKTFNINNSAGTATTHPLGAELWAYVPFNLLPHLRWLTEADYPHVYYMDGPPKVYDVNIFTADTDHPGGWGTILVAGMRFGGGDLTYDHDNDGTADVTTRSAYVVLDITNPEVAPKLIAEISDANLGFTTNVPTLAVKRVPNTGNDFASPATNKWYLVFGSGPTDLDTATSSQNAHIYAYDLNTKSLIKVDTAVASSYVGNPKSADWETDFIDDVVYFGTVSGTETAPTGQLMRLRMDTINDVNPVTNVMLNTNQPFVAAPTIGRDVNFNKWVFAGTGRFFTSDDKGSTGQQSFYGIKENYDAVDQGGGVFLNTFNTSFTTSSLQNVTGVQVFADGSLNDSLTVLPAFSDPSDPSNTTTDTFAELTSVIKGKSGWYRNFTADGSNPSRRNLTSSTLLFDFILFTTFDPPLVNACDAQGSSNLFAVDFTTGTANPGAGLGTSSTVVNASGSYITLDNIDLGPGMASEPTPNPYSADNTADGNTQMGVNIQMSGGNTTTSTLTGATITGGRSGWREIFDF